MKKIMMIVCMMLVSAATFAEKGDKWVGVNANYALDEDYHGFGLGAKAQYEMIDHVRLEGAFNYFFKQDGVSLWDLNANLHYLIELSNDRAAAYPLVGVSLLSANVDTEGTDNGGSDFGFNVGGGIEYHLTDNLKVNAELRYQLVKDWHHFVLAVGVAIPF